MTERKAFTSSPRILISGGGTGGHIFPALSIANAIKRLRPDAEILFVGALGRMEMERVPAAGYPILGLEVAGFDRKRLWRNFGVLLKLWRSMRKAKKILRDFQPMIAIGVGGYASGPMLKAAQKAGIPTLLQEQNSYAGVTNKLLARNARKICVAYDGMERFFPSESIVFTGNPVRHDIACATVDTARARTELGLDPDRPVVLVVGGSLGSRTVNIATSRMIETLKKSGAQVYWQTGKGYYDNFKGYNDPAHGVHVHQFITNMATAYRAATIVVSRAGAGTISELQLLGMPAILIPSPNVAEDHQRKNAMALVEKGAAIMILDADAEEHLAHEVEALLADPAKQLALRTNILKMAQHNSDEKIAQIALNLIK